MLHGCPGNDPDSSLGVALANDLGENVSNMEIAAGWVHLQSSVFAAARYFEEKLLLYLEFNSGAIYRYFEFPPHQYRALLAADSHGNYFNRHILGKFREELVRPSRPT